jgi:uncharacterized protein YgbK (DUF1537 family)
MLELGHQYTKAGKVGTEAVQSSNGGKAIILAGSCSAATLGQIAEFKGTGGKYFHMDPVDLVNGTQTKEEIWKDIEAADEETVLVYSSDQPEKVKEAQKLGAETVSAHLEQTTAYLAKQAVENGFNRIIVAGGETSGAVTKILGYDAYVIGESIAPGVPIMAHYLSLSSMDSDIENSFQCDIIEKIEGIFSTTIVVNCSGCVLQVEVP